VKGHQSLFTQVERLSALGTGLGFAPRAIALSGAIIRLPSFGVNSEDHRTFGILEPGRYGSFLAALGCFGFAPILKEFAQLPLQNSAPRVASIRLPQYLQRFTDSSSATLIRACGCA
jgi:hypothetical protein